MNIGKLLESMAFKINYEDRQTNLKFKSKYKN